MSSIKETITKAVKEFNKYRAPEAEAELISLEEECFKIEFTEPFFQACGFYDYFDDSKVFLEEIGSESNIAEIKETQDGAVAKFALNENK